MAESKGKSRRRSSRGSSSKSSSGSSSGSKSGSSSGSKSSSTRNSGGSSSSSKRNDRSAREMVIEAVRQVQDLIGRPVESVTGMEKNGGEWTVTLEVTELERIPNTTDVLGKYEVKLDRDGELVSAHRVRRYHRADAGDD